MMPIIKIKFVDFWFGFSPENNYFFRLLSNVFSVEFSENPEIIIYSCFGTEYLKYSCIRIFYTGENLRPDFTGCDYAISFDYNKDPRHFRLPLYALYINQNNAIERLLEKKTWEEAKAIWQSKTKFCCMVVSNGQSKKRLDFFEKLSRYKTVDSGGKIMNNVGGPVKDKLAFIRDYRFVISFENEKYPGYTTEKIIEPFLVGSIPLYWGNPYASKDFNEHCFLQLASTKSDEEFIAEILELDNNEQKAIHMLMQTKFPEGKIPTDVDQERLIQFLQKIIIAATSKVPVAKSWKKYLHLFKVKKGYYKGRIKAIDWL